MDAEDVFIFPGGSEWDQPKLFRVNAWQCAIISQDYYPLAKTCSISPLFYSEAIEEQPVSQEERLLRHWKQGTMKSAYRSWCQRPKCQMNWTGTVLKCRSFVCRGISRAACVILSTWLSPKKKSLCAWCGHRAVCMSSFHFIYELACAVWALVLNRRWSERHLNAPLSRTNLRCSGFWLLCAYSSIFKGFAGPSGREIEACRRGPYTVEYSNWQGQDLVRLSTLCQRFLPNFYLCFYSPFLTPLPSEGPWVGPEGYR